MIWVGSLTILALLGSAPARADEKADALLAEVRGVTLATQSLSGDFSFVQQRAGSEMKFDGKFELKRPNLAHIEMGEPLARTIVSDGKTVWSLLRPLHQYTKKAADTEGISLPLFSPITFFFYPGMLGTPGPAPKGAKPAAVTTKLAGKETIEGTEYQVIEVTQEKPVASTTLLYIGADKRLARMTVVRKGTNPVTLTYLLKNVKADSTLDSRDFTFTPPKDAQLMTPAGPEETGTPPKGKKGK